MLLIFPLDLIQHHSMESITITCPITLVLNFHEQSFASWLSGQIWFVFGTIFGGKVSFLCGKTQNVWKDHLVPESYINTKSLNMGAV